jgi:DNA-binding NarL/FixJ family response regulator
MEDDCRDGLKFPCKASTEGRPTAKPIRVAVIGPYPIFLEGVVQAIKRCNELEFVARAANMREMEFVLRLQQLDVLIIDNSIPEIEVMLKGVQRRFGCKVVVLKNLEDAKTSSNGIAAPVHGYILKGISGLELVSVIKKVSTGQVIGSPEPTPQLLRAVRNKKMAATKSRDPLSHREREVLQQVLRGLSNQEIAMVLGLRLGTVKQYMAHLFKKMRVRNRIEAIRALQRAKLSES